MKGQLHKLLMLLVLMCCVGSSRLWGQNSRVDWYTFDAGGGRPSSSTSIVISSVGQSLIGPTSAANTRIESGFLTEPLFRGTIVPFGTWTQTSTAFLGNVYALVKKGQYVFAGASATGVHRSADEGLTFTTVNSGLTTTSVYSMAVLEPYLFAGTAGGGVFQSTDNGGSWTAVNTGLTNLTCNAIRVFGQYIFAGTNNGVYRSSNSGAGWIPVNNGLTNLFILSFTSFGTTIFVGTFGGGVFRSTNNGDLWMSASSGLANLQVNALTVNSNSSLFAGTASGVYTSTNQGSSWFPFSGGLPSGQCYSLLSNGQNVFAGTGNGAYLTVSGGWSPFNGGMNFVTYSLAADLTYLFAGTAGSSVWRLPALGLTEVGEIVTTTELPQEFHLQQNFPNPFNPTTTIQYALPHAVWVSLKVYNILGQEVATMVDEFQEAGYKSVEFNSSGLASGVYFYRLITPLMVTARKMILMK